MFLKLGGADCNDGTCASGSGSLEDVLSLASTDFLVRARGFFFLDLRTVKQPIMCTMRESCGRWNAAPGTQPRGKRRMGGGLPSGEGQAAAGIQGRRPRSRRRGGIGGGEESGYNSSEERRRGEKSKINGGGGLAMVVARRQRGEGAALVKAGGGAPRQAAFLYSAPR